MSKARKAKRGREWAAKGYGSSPSPRLPLFLCSEMNFRLIMFSETQRHRGHEKRSSAHRPCLHQRRETMCITRFVRDGWLIAHEEDR